MSRLYLKNLPSDTTRDDIIQHLERFGKLTEFKLFESETKSRLSYGFAQYHSAQDARFVLDTFRDRPFLGHRRTVIELARPLRKDISYTEPRSGRNASRQRAQSPRYAVQYYSNRTHQCRYPVLVDNIPRHICWQELKDFGRLAGGAVAFCDLDPSRNGRGFIEYLSREDAEEAVQKLDGQRLGGFCRSRIDAFKNRSPSSKSFALSNSSSLSNL
ncbi:Serine/arginine-rich splicing factor 6 [Mycena venus]|uniref:Serine/arginine-rich splicing factor 6 n=1 Tax=Mycena venus TaxID=2733690 RepID=A0A8H7CYJ5_9AGAR|nr:Serine/arginine-rich splicing factor 6 [Mycena venus]